MKNITIKEIIDHPQAGSITCIVAGIVLLMILGQTLTNWVEDWQRAHQEVKIAPTLTAHPKNALLAQLPKAHLFGHTLAETSGIPITSLQLQITGIIKGATDPAASKVIIMTGGQLGKVYRVGDRLPSGVRIDTITPDAVILENDGQLEKLPLPRRKHTPLLEREVT